MFKKKQIIIYQIAKQKINHQAILKILRLKK